MKSLPRVRLAWLAGILLVMTLGLTACKPDATSEIISPDLGPRLVAAEESMAVVAVQEEEVELPTLSDLSEEEIVAGLSDEMAAALNDADASNGETVALTNGCIGCHALDPEAVMTGPTWYHVGDTAVSRVEGQSPAAYLYDSIIAPNDFVVADYQSGLMPQTYADSIGQEDMADLIAYLLAQNEGSGE